MTKEQKHSYHTLIALILAGACQAAFGQEIILKRGDVLDLGRDSSGSGTFRFDRLTMEAASFVLIPSSRSPIDITINNLSTRGVSYFIVYDDDPVMLAQEIPAVAKPSVCTPGSNGQQGIKGSPRQPVILKLQIGFGSVDQVVVLAEGLPGFGGGKGGRGQDGGDSGGPERCVVNHCHAGNGGNSGPGGRGGDGSAGARMSLNYSGLPATQIDSISSGSGYFNSIARDISNIPLKEKSYAGFDRNSAGFMILMSNVGQQLALQSRIARDSPPSDAPQFPGTDFPVNLNILLKKKFTAVLAGGIGGPGGPEGGPGVGGNGYQCTLGKDQKVGIDGQWIFGPGLNGGVGNPGTLEATKLD